MTSRGSAELPRDLLDGRLETSSVPPLATELVSEPETVHASSTLPDPEREPLNASQVSPGADAHLPTVLVSESSEADAQSPQAAESVSETEVKDCNLEQNEAAAILRYTADMMEDPRPVDSFPSANQPALDYASDSGSDFIRLEVVSGNETAEETGNMAEMDAEDVMNVSVASVNSNFNFMSHNRALYEEMDGDADTESGAEQDGVDDRIESDQSDSMASPNDAGDLSFSNDIGDIPLVAGNVARQYIHQPNQRLDGTLDIIVVLVVSVAIGIGIGHAVGSKREQFLSMATQRAQQQKLQDLQFDFLKCQKQLEIHRSDKLQNELFYKERKSALLSEIEKLKKTEMDLQHDLSDCQMVRTRANSITQQLEILRKLSEEQKAKLEQLQDVKNDLESATFILQKKLEIGESQIREQKIRINKLEQEKVDLGVEIGRLRYQPHPGNHRAKVVDGSGRNFADRFQFTDQKNRINQLQHETAHLETVIGRLRYQSPSSPVASRKGNCGSSTVSENQDSVPTMSPIPPSASSRGKTGSSDLSEVKESVGRVIHGDDFTTTKSSDLDHRSQQLSPRVTTDLTEEDGDNVANFEQVKRSEKLDLAEVNVSDDVTVETEGEDIEVTEDNESSSTQDEKAEVQDDERSDNVKVLREQLQQEKNRSEMWRNLYLRVRNHSQDSVNTTKDFLACLGKLAGKVNMTYLEEYISSTAEGYLNFTTLAATVHSLKNAVFQSFSEQEKESASSTSQDQSGYHDDWHEEEQKQGSREKWTDNLKDFLNKTKTSVENVSRQIFDAWVQVRNLSVKLWEEHEPSLRKVADELRSEMKNLGHIIKENLRKKSWFRREHHHSFHSKSREFSEEEAKRSRHKKDKNQWKQPQSKGDYSEDHRGSRDSKSEFKRSKRLPTKFQKRIQIDIGNLMKMVNKIGPKDYKKMDQRDIQKVVERFEIFRGHWNVEEMLENTERTWYLCQYSWWQNALHGRHVMERECKALLICWQKKISERYEHTQRGLQDSCGFKRKGREDQHHKKGNRHHEKKKFHDKHNGHPRWQRNGDENIWNKYEMRENGTDSEKHIEEGWYIKRMEDRQKHHKRQLKGADANMNWYDSWSQGRIRLREEEQKSDWVFDRAYHREDQRKSVDDESNWFLAKAKERENLRDKSYIKI